MQGIELSHRFYREVVRPWLASTAPGLPHAAALIGYGSELLGFDDETSKDHDWGPRVHVFLAPAVFHERAHHLVAEFSRAAPPQFLGEPVAWRSRPHPPASGNEAAGSIEHGLEIHTVEGTLEPPNSQPQTRAPIQPLMARIAKMPAPRKNGRKP